MLSSTAVVNYVGVSILEEHRSQKAPSLPVITRVQSFTFAGIEAIPVTVEAHISAGIPSFTVVGLADKAVGETQERVRCAFASLDLALPPKRILVNLVPADIPKEGSHFDLPIALALLAARMTSIMPDLDRHQILQVSRICSLSGLLKDGQLITRPSFRDPHHSLSLPALADGGARARPGEVSLAQHGILFLDELPEFSRVCLEALRQPIETGTITVARAAHHVTYPAHFQLVAAMNPCRCGYFGDADRQCRKAPRCAEDYTARISGR